MTLSPSHPCEARTILVVDDEQANRCLLDAMLSQKGYRVLAADGGRAALSIMREQHLDLVLLDVMMPEMDGVEVCRTLRQQLGNTEVPVVFITALSDRESRVRARRAGGDDFVVKPIEQHELLLRVENWMKLGSCREIEREHSALRGKSLPRLCEGMRALERMQGLETLIAGMATFLGRLCADGFDAAARDELGALHARLAQMASNEPAPSSELVSVAAETSELMRVSGQLDPAQLSCSFPEAALQVPLARGLLTRALLHPLRNAAQAFEPRAARASEASIHLTIQATSADKVRVMIEDNGPGVAEDVLHRAFEPFFTTKDPARFLGLGLSDVKDIVERVGGTVELHSITGSGTQCIIDLPLHAGAGGVAP